MELTPKPLDKLKQIVEIAARIYTNSYDLNYLLP